MKKNFKLKIAFLWSSVSWEAERAQYAVWQSSVTSFSHFLCQRSLWAPGKVFIKAVCVALGCLGNWPVIRQYLTYASFPLMANSSHQRRSEGGPQAHSSSVSLVFPCSLKVCEHCTVSGITCWQFGSFHLFHFSISSHHFQVHLEHCLGSSVCVCVWFQTVIESFHIWNSVRGWVAVVIFCVIGGSVLPQGWCVSKVTTAICFAVGCFYTDPGSPQYVPEQLRVRVGRQYFNWKELHSVLQLLNANRQAEQGNTIYCNLFLATVVWI